MMQTKVFYGAGSLQKRINDFLAANKNYIKDVSITHSQSESTFVTIILYKVELGYVNSIVDVEK